MTQTNEDYVSFETAKLLKEKGFDWYTYAYYEDENNPNINLRASKAINWNKTEFISKPTLQMAMKWLREAHDVTIVIDTNDIWLGEGNRFFWCKIYYKMGNRIEIKWYYDPSKPKDMLRYQTYEQACESAIKYCLEKLI